MHLFLVILQLITCYGTNYYVVRFINGEPKHCKPYYNCEPGNEILPCDVEFTKELCQPCYDDPNTSGPDFVQPDYISSVDGDTTQLKCFKPLTINGKKRSCTGRDITYDKVDLGRDKIRCLAGRGCKCDLNTCNFGDPCYCDNYRHTQKDGCEPGLHLNNSGVCVPCPPGFVKNESGCGPCRRVPSNNTRATTTTTQQSIITSKPRTTTTPAPVPITEKPTTASKSTTVAVPLPRDVNNDDGSSTPIIVGIVAAVVVILALIISVILCRKGKFERITGKFCGGDRRNLQREVEHDQAEELQALNELQVEQQDNTLNNIRVIEHQRNVGYPNNNNINRTDSDCPGDRFDSTSTVSINRQLSNISTNEHINSNMSENSPLLKVEKLDSNPHVIHRINSVPNPQIIHRSDSLPNPQVLNRAESVPQQVSENGYRDFLINSGQQSFHNSSSQLVPSPTTNRQPYMDIGGGACIPPPDFANIQSSNPIMNTELPNIGEFKRSLSKDSSSSVEFHSGSPFNSIPEETGKDIQEDDSNISRVVAECPHISDAADYSDCHLSQYPDTPLESDITNQIDSRLEQYNHTITGTDEGATCSVQRLPSEHEEETMKKKDLESTLDSGMASKEPESSDLSRSDHSV